MYAMLVTVASAMGLTVLLLGFETGPAAWLRERARPGLQRIRGEGVLDCAICFSFWAGAVAGLVGGVITGQWELVLACLVCPALVHTTETRAATKRCSCQGKGVTPSLPGTCVLGRTKQERSGNTG